jgi:hypothetical protein
MRRICLLIFVLGSWLAAARTHAATEDIRSVHRLYDMKPVSEANPVVARVESCGIEIPASEYRAYLDAEVSAETPQRLLTTAEKRVYLERLLDEHFLLWDGYCKNAEQTDGMIQTLHGTLDMILEETLTEREVGAKSKTADDYSRLLASLRDVIFAKTDIKVSVAAYEKLKVAVRSSHVGIGQGGTGAPRALQNLPDTRLTSADREQRLAECKLGFITVGDFISVYSRFLPDKRPDVQTKEGLEEVLKQMLGHSLLVQEARDRGLEATREVQEKLQINRNVLTRFYALDQLTAKAVARTKEAGYEATLEQWYAKHLKDRYTTKDKNGNERVLQLDEERESIQNDHFEDLVERVRADELQTLRRGRKIEVDQLWLESTEAKTPLRTPLSGP